MRLGRSDIPRSGALASVAASTLAALGLLAALPGIDRASADACPNAHAGIDEANARELGRAITCLINRDRAGHDLPRLEVNRKLEDAARKHNRTMLDRNCWAHDCPGEPGLGRRIKNTGYLNGAERWIYAEVFGCAATPRAMLNAWLQSGRRRSIREPRFRDVGVAAAREQVGASNCDGGDEATYTVVFARRWG